MASILSRSQYVNQLRAKFCTENINMCLHFISYLHTDTMQAVELVPQVFTHPT